jgi:hypothetical protein
MPPQVFQVRKRDTGRVYAMKVMRKVSQIGPIGVFTPCKACMQPAYSVALSATAACYPVCCYTTSTRGCHHPHRWNSFCDQRGVLNPRVCFGHYELYTPNPEQDRILARDHGEYVRAERDVLTSVRHPFIVQLHWSFQVSTMLRHHFAGVVSLGLMASTDCTLDGQFGSELPMSSVALAAKILLQSGKWTVVSGFSCTWYLSDSTYECAGVPVVHADGSQAVSGARLRQRRPPVLQLVQVRQDGFAEAPSLY